VREATGIDWDEYARCYDEGLLALRPYRQMLQDVASRLGSSGAVTLLDASCGTGNLIDSLFEHSAPGSRYVGIDSSRQMLERARRKHGGKSSTRLLAADLDGTLPFKDGGFSAVACVNTLYAVAEPAATLRELSRVTGRGGMLLVATPKRGFENGLILKAHAGSEQPDAFWGDGHSSPQREEALIRMAVQDEPAIQALLLVAKINRQIARSLAFHFFEEARLLELIEAASYRIQEATTTYAGQALLVLATRI
jgi:ubiquinone/menaquinone biosynthesis C-methylase UbiE